MSRGAAPVFVVDKAPDWLALAERDGATAVNFAAAEPAQVITDTTDGAGVDCGVEAVSYQAHDQGGQEQPEMVLDKLIEVVRATGRIGVVGVYNLEFAERAGVTATVTGQKTIAHLPAKTNARSGGWRAGAALSPENARIRRCAPA